MPVFAGLGKQIPLRRGFAPPELRGYGAAETLVAAGVNGMPYGNAYAMPYAINKEIILPKESISKAPPRLGREGP